MTALPAIALYLLTIKALIGKTHTCKQTRQTVASHHGKAKASLFVLHLPRTSALHNGIKTGYKINTWYYKKTYKQDVKEYNRATIAQIKPDYSRIRCSSVVEQHSSRSVIY